MSQYGSIEFAKLLGKTIAEIRVEKGFGGTMWAIEFIMADGSAYVQQHQQDCCETVWLEDVIGDLNDLLGHPLLMAEEVTEDDMKEVPDSPDGDTDFVGQWTFYKLATQRGYVTLRWFGSSNGYYSMECGLWEVGGGHGYDVARHLESDEEWNRTVDVYKARPQLPFH